MLAAQDLGVGFSRAAAAAERQSDGVVLGAQLVDVLGESIYIVTTSSGARVLVSADSGSVENVETAPEEVDGVRGLPGGRGHGTDLGSLLEAVGADIDFDEVIETAIDEADREDVRSVRITRDAGIIVAHVTFGDGGPFFSEESEVDHATVVVDMENNEALDVIEGPAMRMTGFAGRMDPRGEFGPGSVDRRFSDDGRLAGRNRAPGDGPAGRPGVGRR
jgi:hypothetical protein